MNTWHDQTNQNHMVPLAAKQLMDVGSNTVMGKPSVFLEARHFAVRPTLPYT
jgi:hypothetical protein